MLKQRVLISGAGIAGLTMARCLDDLNIDYVIIEKYLEPSTSSSGIALPFNAIQALRELKLAEPVLAKSHQVKSISYTKQNGDILSSASLLEEPLDQDKFVSLKRSDLLGILDEGIKTKIFYNSLVTKAEKTGSKFLIDSNNSEVSGEYDLVVCAEGLESSLRKQAFPEQQTILDHGICCWRFMIDQKNHGLEPTYMLHHTELFMAYPLSKDTLYCYGHIRAEKQGFESKNHIYSLKTLFKDFNGPVPNILESLTNQKIHFSNLRSVIKPYYYSDNIIFIGDASSACSPLLQQGAACAFEDALALTKILKEAQSQKMPFGEYDIGKHYQALRKERVDWIVSSSDDPIKLMKKMKNPLLRFIRNKMVSNKGPLNIQGWRTLAQMKK